MLCDLCDNTCRQAGFAFIAVKIFYQSRAFPMKNLRPCLVALTQTFERRHRRDKKTFFFERFMGCDLSKAVRGKRTKAMWLFIFKVCKLIICASPAFISFL